MTLTAERLEVTLQSRKILTNVNLALAGGQTIGLLGPNGSGKSTLLRCLAGLYPGLKPRIRLNGDPLNTLPLKSLARRMAFVPQHAEADGDLSVEQIACLGRTPHRRTFGALEASDCTAVEKALDLMQLSGLRHRVWRQLSGGERQRCQIARALAQQPEILLLDEPTNHLDIHHQLELMGLISRLPVTVVVALHDLNLAANYCQQLVVIERGRVVSVGAPEAVLTPEEIEKRWKVKAKVQREAGGTMSIQYLPLCRPA
ncbi:ABC transporter ATP-binding protein [Enterobacter sp. C2]|uniref:ABC transporter ATP-binding protein n=1 Tax=Enterobacter sp. C2 TaxID=2870346 RepID=UPI001CA38BB4|nr:ABC transporter ATP-binding protein [Enterobacter sp. C2]